MEILIKQRRGRFSGSGQDNQEKSKSIRERRLPQQSESIKEDNKVQNWFRRQFSSQMSQDYDSNDSEFATAIAAAAFAIFSLEEASSQHEKKMREDLQTSRTKMKSRREDSTIGLPAASSRLSRQPSGKDAKNTREASIRKSPAGDQQQMEIMNLKRRDTVETKADAWEKSQMEKIRKRYEKMKSTILDWENEKKMKAKLRMERKKGDLEARRARNLQHYQIKIARIDQTAGGARAQVEEKIRNEESKVKEKAKKIRSTGKVPVKCLCF